MAILQIPDRRKEGGIRAWSPLPTKKRMLLSRKLASTPKSSSLRGGLILSIQTDSIREENNGSCESRSVEVKSSEPTQGPLNSLGLSSSNRTR